MNILADENMPLAKELFSEFGNVILKPGRTITPSDLKDIDLLLIRSVTKVNEDLIKEANNLKFIGTATAGFDHVDTELLTKKNILFSNAQGCNKISVGEYVLSSIMYLTHKFDLNLQNMSIGIIGAGATGSEVIKRANTLGLKVVISDPPLKETNKPQYKEYCNFEECLKCDIVSFHVPLIKEGKHKTFHMLNKEMLDKYFSNNTKYLINASRGEVFDDLALVDTMKNNKNLHLVKDVWEDEPNILAKELINLALITTPHIAGYSYEGKCRGTYLLYLKLCEMLNHTPRAFSSLLKEPEISQITISDTELNYDLIRRIVHLVYDVRRDSDTFRLKFTTAESFDALRKNYRERRELSSLKVNCPQSFKQKLTELGFNCN
jgi:erythronate-4-phosphate dehydrogenase